MKGEPNKGLSSEDHDAGSDGLRVARGIYLTGEEPDDVTHLSDAKALAPAPYSAKEIRFGWNPNLTKKK